MQAPPPAGSIVGRVTSLRTGDALTAVNVTAVSSGGVVSATTDGSGAYTLGTLAPGVAYDVRFEHAGYVTSFGVASVPNTAGDRTAVLDAALAMSDASVKGTVIAFAGQPAVGAVVRADLRDLGFDLVVEPETDATGAYELTGLPGSPRGLGVPVTVAPFDADADGMPDYDALSAIVQAYPAAASIRNLDLRAVAGAPANRGRRC